MLRLHAAGLLRDPLPPGRPRHAAASERHRRTGGSLLRNSRARSHGGGLASSPQDWASRYRWGVATGAARRRVADGFLRHSSAPIHQVCVERSATWHVAHTRSLPLSTARNRDGRRADPTRGSRSSRRRRSTSSPSSASRRCRAGWARCRCDVMSCDATVCHVARAPLLRGCCGRGAR